MTQPDNRWRPGRGRVPRERVWQGTGRPLVTRTESEIRIQPPEIVLRKVRPCTRCGVELWSRGDSGLYEIVDYRESGVPLVEPHYWLFSCPVMGEQYEEGW